MTYLAIGSLSALLVLLALGVPIYIVLMGLAVLLLLHEGGSAAGIAQDVLDHMNSATLMAVPFFVLAAGFVQGGGIARSLLDAAHVWVSRVPGGMALTGLLATGIFAAINGSSVATALAMGTMIVPEMIKRGYSRPFALGLTASAGTLGILIPPSMPLVVYGLVAETSIPRLFLAGVMPGLLQMLLFAAVILLTARKHGGQSEPFPGWDYAVKANIRAFPALSLPILVLGGIYGGFVTITEAAALAVALAMIISLFVYRSLPFGQIPQVLVEGISRTAAILVIIAGANLLSIWFTRTGLAAQLVGAVRAWDLSALEFLIVMNVILLVLGTVLEGYAMILLTLPLTLPVMDALGIDRVHYAIIMTINIELAMLSPPVGMNLFVMAEAAKAPVREVERGVIPFFLAMVVLLILVTLFPTISTWLPNLVLGPPR